MNTTKHTSNSESQTRKCAADLAKTLKGGEVIKLSGNLGSGKTVFTKGLAAAMGITDSITSPTFAIMNLYDTAPLKLCHVDAYRLTSAEDAGDITEYFGAADTVTVVEWPDKLGSFLDRFNTIAVEISYLGENSRQIDIRRKQC